MYNIFALITWEKKILKTTKLKCVGLDLCLLFREGAYTRIEIGRIVNYKLSLCIEHIILVCFERKTLLKKECSRLKRFKIIKG